MGYCIIMKKIWFFIFFAVLIMRIFDAHTHLNQEDLFPNRKEHLEAFAGIGGHGLVNIWANRQYNTNGLTISNESRTSFPDLWIKASLGIHPCDVGNAIGNIEEEITLIKQQIETNRDSVVAIWECWIDLHYPEGASFLELQRDFFRAQCELAREFNLPVVIHSRDAFSETLEILREFKDLVIYFHCWGYWPDEIKVLKSEFNQLFIGFTGNISYPKAEEIRASLRETDFSQILLETDAPYLSPQGFRGQINSPAKVSIVGKFAAETLGISEEKLWAQVEENFWRLYRR